MSKESKVLEKEDLEPPLPTKEAYFECVRSHKEGPIKVYDPNDPIWDDPDKGLKARPSGLAGTFIINDLLRGPRGDVIGKKNTVCLHMEPMVAQETLQMFINTGTHVEPGSGKGIA